MTKKTIYASSSAVLALCLSTAVLAATPVPPSDTLRAKVTGTVISPDEGNCFAKLLRITYLATGGPAVSSCNNDLITFKCDGDDKDSAYHKFDIAQKSEITGQVMIVKIEDPGFANGSSQPCFASMVESSTAKK